MRKNGNKTDDEIDNDGIQNAIFKDAYQHRQAELRAAEPNKPSKDTNQATPAESPNIFHGS
ncbi:MAG: hypothetical protein OZ917_12455 [Candidatus Brocadiaceae bacterium]|nr:hypothetical protein [Candidatus Brocadiaceae bacterium]